MRPFHIVCYFFELVPVDRWDFGFELVVLFFGALFVRGLAVGAAVVREVRDSADFAEVFPGPGSDTWPVSFFNGNSDTGFVLTPMPLERKPELKMLYRSDI